jgi:hypothetical protein
MGPIEVHQPSLWWNLLWVVFIGAAIRLDIEITRKGVRGLSTGTKLGAGLLVIGYILGIIHCFQTQSFGGILCLVICLAITSTSYSSGRAAEAFIKFLDPIMFERGDARDLKRSLRESDAVAHFIKRGKTAQALKICEQMYEEGHMSHSTLECMRDYLSNEAANKTAKRNGNRSQDKRIQMAGLGGQDEFSDPLAVAFERINAQRQKPTASLVTDEEIGRMISERRLGQADVAFQNRLKATPIDLDLNLRYLRFLLLECQNTLGADKILRGLHANKHFTADEVASVSKQVTEWKASRNGLAPAAK